MKSEKNASPQQSNPFDELELPEGWTLTKIRDLVTINYGKGLKQANRAGGSVSVYGSNGIVGAHNKALTNGPSIIIGRKGSIGEVHYSAQPSWPIDTTYYIDQFKDVDQTFLVFALKMLNLSNLDTSTAIPGLNRNDIYDQKIPFPPLDEQQRIVARVEALLSHVDAAGDRLSRVPAIMKKFRQAVLAAACSGRLTEEWREENPDVEPVKNLLKKIHNESLKVTTREKKNTETGDNCVVSSFFDIPNMWGWVLIEEILKNPQHLSYGILKPGDPDPNGVPMVRVLDIGNWGLNKTKIMRVSPLLAAQYERTKLEEGDILLAVMATVGRAIIVPPSLKGANVNRALAVIRLHPLINPHYACNVIRSPYFQDVFASEKIGSAQARINISDLRKFSFPLPPLAEQHEIVRHVEALFERADAIEREVAAAGRRCERLTQAVMVKAFSGRL